MKYKISFRNSKYLLNHYVEEKEKNKLLSKLSISEHFTLIANGHVYLKDAEVSKLNLAIHLCKGERGLYFSYPQGYEGSLKVHD